MKVGYWDPNPESRDGSGAGRGWRMGFSPLPRIVLSCPIIAPLHDRKFFFTPFPPLGAPQNPTPTCKTLLLVNLPTTITIFFLIKLISLIKIYLKLQINLSNQIKLIFSKNWIILSNCSTRQYHQKKKKKSHSTKSIIQ